MLEAREIGAFLMLNYKSIPFEVKAVSPGAEGGWEIAGLASTWWGEPDAYNDVVAPGAFAASIAERATKFLYEHHTPIGKQLELRETDDGLYGRWSIVDTAAGTDAHKLAKAGVLDSLSIGYVPLEWELRADGVRVLQKVTLYEVSAVSIPANANAVITDVKSERGYAPPAPAATRGQVLHIADELRRRRLARHGIALAAPTEAVS
jgi:HK97 family phage prohead protease